MSWTKTNVEGRVMWERSDGLRVNSHQEIEALRQMELRQAKEREDRFLLNRNLNNQNDSDNEEYTKADGYATSFVILFVLMVLLIHWLRT